MADPEVLKLISDLRKWCDVKRGRRAYLARVIGIEPRRVSDWLVGRVRPSFAMGLRIQALLEGEKPKKEKKAA